MVGAGAVLAAAGLVTFGDRVQIGRNFHLEPSLIVVDDVLISCATSPLSETIMTSAIRVSQCFLVVGWRLRRLS